MQVLLIEGAVQRVAIIDLDVHQGDGTAVCLKVWEAVRNKVLDLSTKGVKIVSFDARSRLHNA